MSERRARPRNRTLLGAKIVFNSGRSAIDCRVRNLSELGACLQVESPLGIPDKFYLIVGDGRDLHGCSVVWRASDRMGVAFEAAEASDHRGAIRDEPRHPPAPETLALRAALDQVQFGVVLLDSELRAQFINRMFRVMFNLPDAKADACPPFVALMYHGRDTQAYEIPAHDLDRYVAQRVALVKAGDTDPIDIRLSDGEVLRCQCAVLPDGGRMLSYTSVTDIVRRSDELTALRTALDRVQEGIVLLDGDLNTQFMNQRVRRFWNISEDELVGHPNIATLTKRPGTYEISADELPDFIDRRMAQIQSGDPTPTDLHTSDGRILRAQVTPLPAGGRMLTYCDVSDLVRFAERMEALATIDSMTGIGNRRHFLAMAEPEWARFQRYQRPLAMLVVDIDYFKSVNDRFGHKAGDAAITAVAKVLQVDRRGSDLVGRFGGDEFVVLLPETDAAQAVIVAERICAAVREQRMSAGARSFAVTVSVGVAAATSGMSGIASLLAAADEALYEAKSDGRNRCAIARSTLAAMGVAAE